MGREVRRVKADWVHPKDSRGVRYLPLMEGYRESLNRFNEYKKEHGTDAAFEDLGNPPSMYEYMPDWNEDDKTHYMMYENVSEGTPISPAFDNIEDLARWLADNEANAGAGRTATYEQWLAMCKQGFAVSGMMIGGRMMSGVEACSETDKGGENG